MIANKSNTKRLSVGKRSGQKNLGHLMAAISCASLILLVGCSGGSGGGDDGGGSVSPVINNSPVEGYAVKGPLKNATASLYTIDLSATDLKGRLLDTGATNDSGSITNLVVPALTSGPFLLEITGGKELDGSTPVIPTLRTVVRVDQLSGETKTPIVVTPLTTLVTEMAQASAARKNSNASGTVTLNNFFTADGAGGEVGAQVSIVKTGLGLGLLNGINLFTTPPLITGSNDAAVALKYRTAIEVNAALFVQMLNAVGTGDADAVFTAFAQDFSDGEIDGSASGKSLPALSGHVTQIINILSQSPSALMALPVPGVVGKTVAELNSVLAQQAGLEQVPVALTITKSTVVGIDTDGDGKIDTQDKFPNNPDEWADTDNDCATALGYTDANYSSSTGGESCGDASDVRPLDASIQTVCQLPGADPVKPIANAGTNKSRFFTKANYDSVDGRKITLSGKGSCDPNGDSLSYRWTVVSVPMAGSLELLGKDSQNNPITKANMLSGSNTVTPSFTANFAGEYVLALEVSDDTGVTWSTPSTVTVNIDKGYYVDVDGKFMFLSSLAALLLLAVPAKLRKKKATN